MLSCRNIRRPSRPRFCISAIVSWRRSANSSRVKCRAIDPPVHVVVGATGRSPVDGAADGRASCRSPLRSWLRVERDHRQSPPIVLFAGQGHAAVAEEQVGFGAGIVPGMLYGAEAEALEPAHDVARQVEHEMSRAFAGDEETPIVRVLPQKRLRELWPHFIRTLGDAWADRRMDAAGGAAQGAEVDMCGEIGGAGFHEDVVLLVPAHGLQAVAEGAAVVAVVDDQGSAAVAYNST